MDEFVAVLLGGPSDGVELLMTPTAWAKVLPETLTSPTVEGRYYRREQLPAIVVDDVSYPAWAYRWGETAVAQPVGTREDGRST